MQEDAGLLVPKSDATPDIAFSAEALSRLMDVCRARMPAETVGALVGTSLVADGRQHVTISGVQAIEFIPAVQGILTLKQQWETLAANVDSAEGNLGIAGWFYADPGMGVFPPRLNILSARQTLELDDKLLLLINPLANQGAFYTWVGETYVHVSGFTEVSDDMDAPVTTGWDPGLKGASRWLETAIAGITTISTRQDIEPLAITEDDSVAVQTNYTESRASHYIPRRKRMRRSLRRGLALAGLGGLLGVALVIALASATLTLREQARALPAPSATPLSVAERTSASLTTQANPSPTTSPGKLVGQVETEPTSTSITQPTVTIQAAGQGVTPSPSPFPTRQATLGPGVNAVKHTVAPGENLSIIAQQYGTTPEAIMQANNLTSSIIHPGNVLVIPSNKSVAP
ncbi:MAG TPA: LysM peptidoglycan-binding domain-containing protein [Chloroflexia bacterium]|nr:LysM peptidoglycan-binding domain-containing protein [Chloroflexia bacterium]